MMLGSVVALVGVVAAAAAGVVAALAVGVVVTGA
jgi:hypothetical protein